MGIKVLQNFGFGRLKINLHNQPNTTWPYSKLRSLGDVHSRVPDSVKLSQVVQHLNSQSKLSRVVLSTNRKIDKH